MNKSLFQLITVKLRIMCLVQVIPLIAFRHALMASITSNALRLIAFENSDMCTWLYIHTYASIITVEHAEICPNVRECFKCQFQLNV